MSHEVLVGVDVGTTSIKALAVTPMGEVLSLASAPTPWRHDGPRADADPHGLAQAVIGVCEQAATADGVVARGPVVVRSIGVTGIAETGVLIDSTGEPCAPAIAWFDPRGDASGVREHIAPRDFQRATGRRLNSKPSITKILWLQRNIPSASRAVRHLTSAEWIVRSLGGEEVSEASLTARTGLIDLAAREPWGPATELVGDLVSPQRIWAGDPAGTSHGEIPAVLRGAVLTSAGIDHQSAVLISGAAREGALFDSMGTAEALIRTVQPLDADQIERLTDDDIDVDWSVMPGLQIMLAGRLTGLTLERIAAMLGADTRAARQELGEAALGAVRGEGPRLESVGNDSITLGGITDGISPALTWRAAVEDLTDLAGVALDQMAAVAGPHEFAVIAGGWTRNAMVAEAKRQQLGDFRRADVDEPGALGAAYQGGVAAGILQRPGADGIPHWLSA